MKGAAMKCPICKSPSTEQASPFCSKRCSQVDLGRWFSGQYAIASDEPITEDDLEALESGIVVRGVFDAGQGQ